VRYTNVLKKVLDDWPHGVVLSGLMIVTVKVGKEPRQVLHLHATVNEHVAAEVRSGEAHGYRLRTEKPIDRVVGPQRIELRLAKPEATAHL